MALSELKLGHPPDQALIDQITKDTNTEPKDGFPDWPVVMPKELEHLGLKAQAHYYDTAAEAVPNEMNDLDHELSLGHVAVIHEDDPLTGDGHFIFVAGRDQNGKYIIGDPNSYSVEIHMDQPVDRSVLETIITQNVQMSYDKAGQPQYKSRGDYKGERGFTSVWD